MIIKNWMIFKSESDLNIWDEIYANIPKNWLFNENLLPVKINLDKYKFVPCLLKLTKKQIKNKWSYEKWFTQTIEYDFDLLHCWFNNTKIDWVKLIKDTSDLNLSDYMEVFEDRATCLLRCIQRNKKTKEL